MFNVTPTGVPTGDQTQHYSVEYDKNATVADIITAICERTEEHGTVTLKCQGSYLTVSFDVSDGRVAQNDPNLTQLQRVQNETVANVSATGGWGRMDYQVTLPATSNLWDYPSQCSALKHTHRK